MLLAIFQHSIQSKHSTWHKVVRFQKIEVLIRQPYELFKAELSPIHRGRYTHQHLRPALSSP